MNGVVRLERIYEYETSRQEDWERFRITTTYKAGTTCEQVKPYDSLDMAVLDWLCTHTCEKVWLSDYTTKTNGRTKRVVSIYFKGLT